MEHDCKSMLQYRVLSPVLNVIKSSSRVVTNEKKKGKIREKEISSKEQLRVSALAMNAGQGKTKEQLAQDFIQ